MKPTVDIPSEVTCVNEDDVLAWYTVVVCVLDDTVSVERSWLDEVTPSDDDDDDVISVNNSDVDVTSTDAVVILSVVFDVLVIKSIEDVACSIVVNPVVMPNGIVETTVLMSLAIVVIIGELVSIDDAVVVVVVAIFCVETPRDVNTFDERLVRWLE